MADNPDQRKILEKEGPPHYSIGMARGFATSTQGDIARTLQDILKINGFEPIQGPFF